MRLLVLDQSRILPWIVEHGLAAEPDIDVEAVACLREAEEILRCRPPGAAVVSVPPAQLDWRKFQHLCALCTPPVPVLYELCAHADPCEIGLCRCEGGCEPIEGFAIFIAKPAPSFALRDALVRLVAEARRLRGAVRQNATTPCVEH